MATRRRSGSTAGRRARTLSLPAIPVVVLGAPQKVKVIYFPKRLARAAPRIRPAAVEKESSPPVRKALARLLGGDASGVTSLDSVAITELAEVGHHLYEAGHLGSARRVFEALVALEPEEAFPYTMLGAVFLAQGEADRALALFSAALQHDPDDVASLVYRGEIRLARRLLRRGTADLQRALELDGDPHSPFAHRARAALQLLYPPPRSRR